MSEITCSCCGSIIDGENFYEVEDSVICEECYRNRTFTCDCCGERYFSDNDYVVYGQCGQSYTTGAHND